MYHICMCLHLGSATRRNQGQGQCLNSKHSSTISLKWCISSTEFLNQLEKGLWDTSNIIFLPLSHVHSLCLIIQMCCVCVIQPWFPQLTKLAKVATGWLVLTGLARFFNFDKTIWSLKSKRINEFINDDKKFNINFSARRLVMYTWYYVLFMYKKMFHWGDQWVSVQHSKRK